MVNQNSVVVGHTFVFVLFFFLAQAAMISPQIALILKAQGYIITLGSHENEAGCSQ